MAASEFDGPAYVSAEFVNKTIAVDSLTSAAVLNKPDDGQHPQPSERAQGYLIATVYVNTGKSYYFDTVPSYHSCCLF